MVRSAKKAARIVAMLAASAVLVDSAVPSATNSPQSDDGVSSLEVTRSAHATARAFVGIASVVSELPVLMEKNEPVTFETTRLTSGGDPVLHMLSSTGVELAMNDNGAGGKAARLRFRAPERGSYSLVVRARTQDRAGRAMLLKNGSIYLRNIRYGGWQIRLPDLVANEQLEAVRLPNGARGLQTLYVLDTVGLHIVRRARDRLSAGGPKVSLTTALGSRWILVAVARGGIPGSTRLVRNDVALPGRDPDGDGLGSELETAIGTCSTRNSNEIVNGFGCRQTADARDTDGDGIGDGWEFLGRDYVTASGSHQRVTLPLWGADPRHKDFFAEIDFQQRCPTDGEMRMTVDTARKFAAIYEDNVAPLSSDRLARHAQSLLNPDGRPGIETHLDIGRPPETPVDETTYGDWGGYTVVEPTGTSSDCNANGANYETAWKTSMAASRRGIFRHGLGSNTLGGQTRTGFPFQGSIHSAAVLAHEAGHSMGLGHSGPSNITPGVDPNCKPNYPSIMNYAFDDGDFTFSDGHSGPPLNNAALTEWQAVSPNDTAFMDTLASKFLYWVDRANGHVDWNRDGTFAPQGTTVRAYANNHIFGDCEYTRYNFARLTGTKSRSTPSVARLGSRIYLFWVNRESRVRYAYSTSGWNCPLPSDRSCGSWSTPRDAVFTAAGGLGVERLSDSSGEELLVVVRLVDGRLVEARLSVSASGIENWTPIRVIPGAAPATGAPSLSRAYAPCAVYVAYRGADGQVRFRIRGCGGGWRPEERAVTSGGPITMAAYAAPAIGQAVLPWRPGVLATYGAFANADGRLKLYGLVESTMQWEPMTFMGQWSERIEGRPAMAWVPTGTQASSPGRFYLMAVGHEPPNKRTVRMSISFTRVTETSTGITKEERVGLNSKFDNGDFLAFGVDLLYEPGIDTNLRSVTTVAIPDERLEIVEFRPKADAINDFTYIDYDDWAYLRLGLCRQVIDPGGLGPRAVRCP